MKSHLALTEEEQSWRQLHLLHAVPPQHWAVPRRLAFAAPVHGFDISNYQPTAPDFRVGGREFGMCKAAEHLSYVDGPNGNGATFRANRDQLARQNLLIRVLYYFARPASTRPEDAASFLLRVVGGRRDREVIMLDYEVGPWSVPWAVTFLNIIHNAGWPSLFYSYLGMLSANQTDGIPQTGTGLVVAAYGCREPGNDRWSHKDAWQHTDGVASVCGNDGPWDCNVGERAVLEARAGGTVVPLPPPPPPSKPKFLIDENQ